MYGVTQNTKTSFKKPWHVSIGTNGLAATSFRLPWGWQMAAVFDRQMSPPGLPEPAGAPSRVSSAGGNGTGLSEDTNKIKATIIQDSGSHMGQLTQRWNPLSADWCTTNFSTPNHTYWSWSSIRVKVKVPSIGRCICETLRCSLMQFSDTSMKAWTPYFVVQSGFFQLFSNPNNSWKEFWEDFFPASYSVLYSRWFLSMDWGLASSCRFFATRTCKEGFYKPSEKLNKR